MNGIARAGLVPGVDISVTGYDDLEEAAIATPALTTVWNGQREVGRRAARALLDKLSGQSVRASQELIKPELHVRQSTGKPRGALHDRRDQPSWKSPSLAIGGHLRCQAATAHSPARLRPAEFAPDRAWRPGAASRPTCASSVRGMAAISVASTPPSSTRCPTSRSSPISASATMRSTPAMRPRAASWSPTRPTC